MQTHRGKRTINSFTLNMLIREVRVHELGSTSSGPQGWPSDFGSGYTGTLARAARVGSTSSGLPAWIHEAGLPIWDLASQASDIRHEEPLHTICLGNKNILKVYVVFVQGDRLARSLVEAPQSSSLLLSSQQKIVSDHSNKFEHHPDFIFRVLKNEVR